MGHQGIGGHLMSARCVGPGGIMNKGRLASALARLRPHQAYSRGFWLTLVIFSLLFGLFLSRTAAPYLRTEYSIPHGDAIWIASPVQNAVTYYRRAFSLDSLPARAIIDIAAPDGLDIYVNGQMVESIQKPSTTVSTLVDVSNYLGRGRNVVAMRIERKTFPGPASLRANIRWYEPGGQAGEIPTDGRWRTSLREEWQGGGALAWHQSDFDDSDWTFAQPLPAGSDLTPHLAHPWAGPDLFRYLPSGEWMRNHRPDASGVGFRREFDLGWLEPRGIRNAWLGVSTATPYTLVINGARSPAMPSTAQYMDTYDIGGFLNSGKNTIEIDTSNIGGDGRVAIAAVVMRPNGVVDLSSDQNWQTRAGDGEWRQVSLMGELQSRPYQIKKTGQVFRTPILKLVELDLPKTLWIHRIFSALPWMITVFAVAFVFVARGLSKIRAARPDAVAAITFPLIFASLALVVAYLLPLDIRITEADIFSPFVALGIAVTTLALLTLTMNDIRHGGR